MKTTVQKWLDRLEQAEKAKGMEEWNQRCKVIKRKYLYEGSQSVRTRKYQLLWSNQEQLRSAIYSKSPKGVVNRRYYDPDPVARTASQILERSINFSLDTGDYHTTFKRVRDDFLLYGRGIARVYYEPTYNTSNDETEDIANAENVPGDKAEGDGHSVEVGSGGGSEYSGSPGPAAGARLLGNRPDDDHIGAQPDLEFENVRIRFVHRQDFLHEPSRIWEEVGWVAFRAFMTKKELAKRFKDAGEDVIEQLQPGNERDEASSEDSAEYSDRELSDEKVAIWECWDKKENKVCWIAKGCSDVLEEGPAYLELDGFFPCPAPAFGTLTNDSLIPVPDYVFYQDQADEIDQLTARIGALGDALKLVGFYPGGPSGEGTPEIERAFTSGFENRMIAVQSWAAFKDSGGGSAPVIFLPVDQVAKIIEACVKLRQQIVEDVYQIVGISDIMRGATDPNETAQAQQMKAQFGGVRMRDRQAELARFCADVCKLTGQIIAVHCSSQTIQKMTNIDLPSKAQIQQIIMQQMMQYRQQIAPMVQQYQQQVTSAQQNQGQQQQGQPQINSNQPPQPGAGIPAPPQIPPPPQFKPPPTEEDVFGLLKDNVLRLFRIDVEAESTVSADESKEKQDRTSLIEAATKFMQGWGPMVQQQPMLAPLAGKLLEFGVRAFRVGRELEEIIEETVEKFNDQAQQGGAQKPDPKAQAEMIKLQGLQVKAAAEIQKAQIEAQKAQFDAQAKMMQIQAKAQADERKTMMDVQKSQTDHQNKVVQIGAQALADHHARQHEVGMQQAQAGHQAALDHHARAHQASIDEQQSKQQMKQQAAQGDDNG